jgi:phosphate transport system protein
MLKELRRLFRQTSLLQEAFDESLEMLRGCQEMVHTSIDSLRYSDSATVAVDIQERDRQINAYEQDVRRKVLTHLATSSPADLHSSLVLTSVVISIERIGDYSKNIYDLAQHHPARLSAGPWEQEVQTMENTIKKAFTELITVLQQDDAEGALELYEEIVDATHVCNDIIAALIKGEGKDISVSDAVTLALYLRYLKRVGAHLRNIATSLFNPFEHIGFRNP